jgi:dephospho-CoA kinase
LKSEKIPKIVGITGGIGSGKTSVIKKFEEIGVPIYIADERAKQLMQSSQVIKNKIIDTFGEDAYTNQGVLNRSYLAHKVFVDSDKLKALNAIVHPEVRKDFNKWVSEQHSAYVLYESALIFEHQQEGSFDTIILVTAPLEQRINRVMKRSQMSREEVIQRINKQLSDEEKAKKSDIIVENLDNMLNNINIIEINNNIISNN